MYLLNTYDMSKYSNFTHVKIISYIFYYIKYDHQMLFYCNF